jgi:hypothetical protein
MLAAFETVPGTKSILLERSALPLALTHVPLASDTNKRNSGETFFMVFIKQGIEGCIFRMFAAAVRPRNSLAYRTGFTYLFFFAGEKQQNTYEDEETYFS